MKTSKRDGIPTTSTPPSWPFFIIFRRENDDEPLALRFFFQKNPRHPQEWTDMIIPYGYGSIPMKIPFLGGWTFILTQLFWCELQGYMVLTHPHMIIPYNSPFHWDEDWPLHNPNVGLLVTPETTTSPWGLALLEPARWQENVPGTWRVWDMCAIYLCRSLVGFFFDGYNTLIIFDPYPSAQEN